MKYGIGRELVPRADRSLNMVVDGIEPERYRCHWFVDGKIETGYFVETDLEESEEAKMGFKRKEKNGSDSNETVRK